MEMNRRNFLFLGAVIAAGCSSTPGGLSVATNKPTKTINAGPAAQYLKDGTYTRFRDLGFFLVRRGANLVALTSICTHRRCKLDDEAEKGFSCPCHGSTFDINGHVLEGPARVDLPQYTVRMNDKNELLVEMAAG